MPACGSESQNCSRVSRSPLAVPASAGVSCRGASSVSIGVASGNSKARKFFEMEISRNPLWPLRSSAASAFADGSSSAWMGRKT